MFNQGVVGKTSHTSFNTDNLITQNFIHSIAGTVQIVQVLRTEKKTERKTEGTHMVISPLRAEEQQGEFGVIRTD